LLGFYDVWDAPLYPELDENLVGTFGAILVLPVGLPGREPEVPQQYHLHHPQPVLPSLLLCRAFYLYG
jgi:hypothetical protein